jgi:hypothetical protein
MDVLKRQRAFYTARAEKAQIDFSDGIRATKKLAGFTIRLHKILFWHTIVIVQGQFTFY